MHWADWITLAGVLVAAVSAGVAWVQARQARGAQESARRDQARAEQQAERATKAAERAAVAEAESAKAAARAADALEKQNAMAAVKAALVEGVPWRLEYQRGDTYELINESATPKFGVRVTGESIPSNRKGQKDRVDGRSSLTFMAHSAFGSSSDIDVRWHRREDLSDEEQLWTGTKPAKPR